MSIANCRLINTCYTDALGKLMSVARKRTLARALQTSRKKAV